MLTSKQRATLRAAANGIDTIIQIGKDGITENLVAQVDTALTARELVKGRVLPNSLVSPREACAYLAEELGAEGVQVVGTKFVLYRENPEKKQFDLK